MILPLKKKEFQKIRDLLVSACGISLGDDKEYLVESRLTDFGNEIGAETFGALHSKVLEDKVNLLPKVIDLMTTNETFWFRDDVAWGALSEAILPAFIEKLQSGEKGSIRIWSAASSTGQEAYSLSILLKELTEKAGTPSLFNRFSILGTDISQEALFLAKAATYSVINIKRGLSEERLKENFSESGRSYVLNSDIKSIVDFRFLNLLDPLGSVGTFDLVLCRNVAIYFHADFKKELFSKIKDVLNPDGLLMLGAAESLFGYSEEYKTIEHLNAIYYKVKT